MTADREVRAPRPTRPSTRQAHNARPRLRAHLSSVIVLVLGLALTTAAVTATEVIYDHNEERLLALRVQDAGALITDAIPSIETPLASAAEIVQSTDGNLAKFKAFITPSLRAGVVVSDSLWIVHGSRATLLSVVGKTPELLPGSARADAVIVRGERSHLLTVTETKGPGGERLGYAYSPPGISYVVYQESAINPNHRSAIERNRPFFGLHYAIYFGRTPKSSMLLATDEAHLPISGRHASVVVPFGADAFLLVMSPQGPLGGAFFDRLPILVGILGGLATLAATSLVERLNRRRSLAEVIAGRLDAAASENQRLYDEQRHIAETLQHALLPNQLPEPPGVEITARYLPGVAGMDIGGDWYDVVMVDDRRFLLVVGDVSGRGLRAATVMAELRYAIRAYVSEGDGPAGVLSKLTQLHGLESDGHFATVLLGLVDDSAGTLTVANAGHLSPILLDGTGARPLLTKVGPPVGVQAAHPYEETTIDLPARATYIAYTDGLVERRDRAVDESIERLATEVEALSSRSLTELLDEVIAHFGGDSDDDTAILGVRWLS